MKTKKLNYRKLARLTGADRASIPKWCADVTDEKEALAIIRECKKNAKAANLDTETGLTWFQSKMREDTLKKRRENEIAERACSDTWITREESRAILTTVIRRLEQLPANLRSQFGLTDEQTEGIRRRLDELRTEAAAEVRGMGGKR